MTDNNIMRCIACKYYERGQPANGRLAKDGECRFNPPTAQRWPRVQSHDWCASWKQK